jgi:hypothetical protein
MDWTTTLGLGCWALGPAIVVLDLLMRRRAR